MDCHHALRVRELALARLAGSPAEEEDVRFLASHLAACAECRAKVEGMEAVWTRLGDDDAADLAPSPAFVAQTSAALAAPIHARVSNVVPFRLRPVTGNLLKAAVVLLVGGVGFLVARGVDRPALLTGAAALPTPSTHFGENVALVSSRTVDAS
ncbi:MAG: hypothetical protein ACXVID_10510, partial [Thermoanaerobaculia bacterium]